MTNIVLILGSLAMAALCLSPAVLRARSWRATVTPLASIIGSGFLVVGPILADTAGSLAWVAMAALCAAGYLFGAVIRFNIIHVEANLAHLPRRAVFLEKASNTALSLAYFVSVAYYLNLLAAFALRAAGIVDPFAIRLLASTIIVVIGIIGGRGGLHALERLEVGTVGIKLSVIGGLMLALGLAYAIAWQHHALITATSTRTPTQALRTVLGLVILVQGFETSRYLGAAYDPDLRVRTMRHAQWISTAIYIGFVFLLTNLFRDGLGPSGGETEIIDMVRPLGWAVVPLLTLAAIASQSSAAVADMNGAGGLLHEVSSGRIPVRLGNAATALASLTITWSGDIYQIITWASQAFVAYYGLQSVQAALWAARLGQWARVALFCGAIGLSVLVIAWAVPAGA